MTNFELKVIPAAQKIVVLAESEFGEAVIQLERRTFSRLIKYSKDLREIYAHAAYGGVLNEEVKQKTSEFGMGLFNVVFQNEILNLFNRTVGGSMEEQINLRLMLGEPGLNSIHWEAMRLRKEYLGLKYNLIRHPFTPYPVKVPSETREKLHVFVVSIDPRYEEKIVREHQEIVNLFRGFGDQIKLTELSQEQATLENIKDVLFEGVDIWHFSGHGMFDPDNTMDSALIVWGKDDRPYDKLSIRVLSTLAMNQNLGFCFLNACNTARESENQQENKHDEFKYTLDHLVNMAHSLIEVGIPIVVATNHDITYEAANLLSKRFYTSVLKYGKPIDQALRDARADLFISAGENLLFSDWSCPALYARSRSMEFGTELLKWEPSFDIYSMRNVERRIVNYRVR